MAFIGEIVVLLCIVHILLSRKNDGNRNYDCIFSYSALARRVGLYSRADVFIGNEIICEDEEGEDTHQNPLRDYL